MLLAQCICSIVHRSSLHGLSLSVFICHLLPLAQPPLSSSTQWGNTHPLFSIPTLSCPSLSARKVAPSLLLLSASHSSWKWALVSLPPGSFSSLSFPAILARLENFHVLPQSAELIARAFIPLNYCCLYLSPSENCLLLEVLIHLSISSV